MTEHELKQALAHVLWIGGGTDAGKTTVSRLIAERCGWQLYHYDRRDAPQVERLAQTIPQYRAFLDSSLDERWVTPEPEQLVRRTLQSFRDRFPLVVAELLALPGEPPILAEGFGLTPELLFPVLSSKDQAIWLVPTPEFKRASMQRRDKPSFGKQTRDPERARNNLLERDRLLAECVQAQAQSLGLRVYEVDGTQPVEAVARVVERHFQAYLRAA